MPVRSAESRLVACGNFLFHRRNVVSPLTLLVLFAAFPPHWPGGSEAQGRWLDLAGLGFALSGQMLRAAVIGFVYIKRGGVDKRIYADTLVTGGFFGTARNPLYLGNLLMLFGLFLIHGNPWVICLGTGLFLFGYASIVAAEEVFLHGKFGAEYEAYCRDVNRWWPKLGQLSTATRGMRFNWRRVVMKDYSTAGAWLTAALILFAYEAVYDASLAAAEPRLAAATALLVLLIGAMFAIRHAKKTGRLTEHSA